MPILTSLYAPTLALLLLPVVVLFIFKKFPQSTKNQNPVDSAAPMPSLLYNPPPKLFDESHVSREQFPTPSQIEYIPAKQPYDAFLVLDVEATCFQGTGFEWANEIIEWPVCLLRWKDKSVKGRASRLEIVGEFRSFVKPTWRPQLSQFCTDLTGITQDKVDYAPTFPKVLKMFARFLAQHGLIDPKNGRPLQRFCWCSDGPFDVRDFVVKQCFISNVPMPSWLKGDVLDARKIVSLWAAAQAASENQSVCKVFSPNYPIRSLNISQQLRVLRLGPFQGRLHCGIDDTRNIARIIVELARRGVRLEPNTPIDPNKRWRWMGRPGEVLEYCLI